MTATETAGRRAFLRLAAVAVLAGLVTTLPGHAVRAADWIEDLGLPLMPGLQTSGEPATVFETGSDRIVVVEASGQVAAASVRRYYGDALVGLGWQAAGADSFVREGERLSLDISRVGALTVVTFRLTPA